MCRFKGASRSAPFDMTSFWKLFFILFAIFFPVKEIIAATDILNTSLSITDGESLVSFSGRFELGFFTPGSSRYRYLGLWYKNHTVPTILWVANREAPLTNRRGVLRVINPGLLVLLNDTNQTIWSSHASTSINNPVAQLLDSGNIVVRDVNDDNKPENYLWQSFDYPTDTYFPGMKFGRNLLTGLERFLLSWKSADDPVPGLLSFHLDPTGYPQVLLKKGGFVTFRVGPWNGIRFGGAAARVGSSFKFTFMMNANEVVYWEDLLDHSVVARCTLGQTRLEQRLARVDQTEESVIYMSMPSDGCDAYGLCGTNGICNVGDSPPCECLDRFVPKDPQNWVRGDGKSGCIRRANLSCKGDVFLKYSGVKLPDATHSWYNTSMTLEECRRECVKNCSCMAYTQLDISSGSECLFWSGEVIDIRSLSSHGQDIYIRLASSESDLPWFDLSTILKATGRFSENNKLGKGGFGTVYMGILKDGQQIAVKRLSKDSTQGHDELKNEIMFLAKLQHRNLVRVLGCCMQGDENLLIYEYLPSKILDAMLFDQTKRTLLDWSTRLKIVNGIARGLLYLHQDSRLRIIHRDLKASYILLDADMNPKISDFGIARSFEGEKTQVRTHRVIETYGYMSPEYVVNGVFSIKSDVFSFGVLVLEIVSGKRNRGFFHDEHHLNLLGHAWTLYNQEKSVDIVDDSLQDSLYYEEMRKTIHIGLLCVQKWAKDRPSMSSVVFMLGNEGWVIPQAKKPGFFTETDVINAHNSDVTNSENEITITKPEGR